MFAEFEAANLRKMQSTMASLVKQFGDLIRQSDPSSYQKMITFLSQMASSVGTVNINANSNDPLLMLLTAQLALLKSENDHLLLEKTRLEETVLKSQTESTNYIFEEYQKLKKAYEIALSTPQHQTSDSMRIEHELLKEDYQVLLDKLSRFQDIPVVFRSSFPQPDSTPIISSPVLPINKPVLHLPQHHQPKPSVSKPTSKKLPPVFMF